MLGKLMKHEWKTTWKIPTGLYAVLLIISAFAGLGFSSPMWESKMSGLDILMVLLILCYYFAIIAVSVGVMLYIAVRFYKSMFTDEGYLTHTLPVSVHQLLISKILIMLAWTLLSFVAIVVSVLVFAGIGLMFLAKGEIDIVYTIRRLLLEMRGWFDMGIISFIGNMILMMIVSLFSGVMMIVGSISIGQMVKGHKILGSIGAYFAISTIIQIVAMVGLIPLMFRMEDAMESTNNVFVVMSPVYWVISLISIVISVGLYFLSAFLVRKKLNLD